jgi:hypothetical protein
MKLKQLLNVISDDHTIQIRCSEYKMNGTKKDVNPDALEVKVLNVYAWEENVLDITLEN